MLIRYYMYNMLSNMSKNKNIPLWHHSCLNLKRSKAYGIIVCASVDLLVKLYFFLN